MVHSSRVLIENVEDTEFVSDLLTGLEQALSGKTINLEVQKKAEPNAKGEILVSILVGLTVNTIYDTLKTLIIMYKNREDFNPDYKVKINGEEKTLEELENKN